MDLELYLETLPWDWPPDSAKVFLSVLSDQKAKESDRLIAAQLAGDSSSLDVMMADALLKVIGNSSESEELRARCAISLGSVLELADTSDFEDEYDLEHIKIDEVTFENIKATLTRIYHEKSTPKLVRRRILESSVRAAQNWHKDAISEAYASGDSEWILTAVFAMNYVRGFDKQIVEALNSEDQDTRFEAITAAGTWEIKEAWPRVKPLLKSSRTPKRLLLAAIDSAYGICPDEAEELLEKFAASDDQDINEAAKDALAMHSPMIDDDFDDDEGDLEPPPRWIN